VTTLLSHELCILKFLFVYVFAIIVYGQLRLIYADSPEAEEPAGDNKEVKTEAVKSELPTVKSESTLSPLQQSDDRNTWSALSTKESSAAPVTAANKFEFVDSVAAFHATTARRSQERQTLVSNVGPHRRALCARRDLAVRRALCKVEKVKSSSLVLSCISLFPDTAVDTAQLHIVIVIYSFLSQNKVLTSETAIVSYLVSK